VSFTKTVFAGFNVECAKKKIDGNNDQFKLAFMSGEYVKDTTTQKFWSHISGEEIADGFGGYTVGGYNLPSGEVIHDTANNRMKLYWSGEFLSVTASGEDMTGIGGFVIYDDTHADKVIVGYAESSEDISIANGTTVNFSDMVFYIS